MNKIPLKAEKRTILGKKVSKLRKQGLIPGHVFGKKIKTEHVSVKEADFGKVLKEAGETGLVDLKIGEEDARSVLIRQVQTDPVKESFLNIDFYQVNLSEKTKVKVPVVLVGDQPEVVHSGEAVVIQPMMEVEVEALPADLPEKIEIDIGSLRAIGDVILVSQLQVPEKVAILAEPETMVVKLDTAVTEEMKKLMEEEAAAQAAAQAAEAPAEAKAPTDEIAEAEEEAAAGESAEVSSTEVKKKAEEAVEETSR